MKLLPAIDIINGKAVRLTRGDYSAMKVYEQQAITAALRFKAAGAKSLHVVDLEGARDGAATNFKNIGNLIRETGLEVQVGGGIRNEWSLSRYLDAGARRVILGTAALENAAFLRAMTKKYGDRIAVGVDAREGLVAVRGWEKTTSVALGDFLTELRDMGVATVIVTDISRDGAMAGSNLPLYDKIIKETGLTVIASGGITALEEIKALRDMGAYGAILGKSLYEGAFTLEEALEAAK